MRLYATPTDLAAHPGGSDVPADDADVLLRTASRMVDEALLGRVYDVDAEGMPTGTDELQATRDAACAIAVELHAIGYNAAGGTQVWDNVKIGTVALGGRKSAEGTVLVMGLPVPHSAVVALRSVGVFTTTTGPTYRGLRVAT